MSDKTKKGKKEIIRYGLAGTGTTLVNCTVFYILTYGADFYYLSANVIAWCVSVIFAYIVNRTYVFDFGRKWFQEFLLFVTARILTLLIENILLFLLITAEIASFWAKGCVCVAVIAGNYVVCKRKVFTGR